MNRKIDLPHPVSRRHALKLAASFGVTLAAVEMTGFPAYAESDFTIATSGGSWGEGIRYAFVEKPGFEKKFGVRPSFLDGQNAALISRMMAQQNNPPFSMTDFLDLEHFLAADAGLIQDYNLDIVTNYKDIVPTAKFPARNGYKNWCASFTLPIISMAWNTKLAPTPTSWDDLWNPKFAGKIGIPDFAWYGLTWLHAINKRLGGNEDDISKAIDAVATLVKTNKAVLFQNPDQAGQLFRNEEIVMAPYWNGRTFSLQADGVPVSITYVPDTIQLHNGFLIAKHTAYTDLANHLVNNALTGELQLEMTRRFRYPPSNATIKLPPDLETYAIPTTALERVVPLDWKKMNEGRSAALDLWNTKVIS